MCKRKLILFILCAIPAYLAARIYPEGQSAQQEVKQVSNTSLEYAYVYIQSDRAVRLTAEDINERGQGNVSFDGNGAMTSGITHVLGSSEIVFNKTGVYQISLMGTATLNKSVSSFTLPGTEPMIALFLNDQRVEGTGIFIPKREQLFPGIALHEKHPISTQAIITVNAGDILTVKWYGRRLVVGEFLDILPNTSIVIKQLALSN